MSLTLDEMLVRWHSSKLSSRNLADALYERRLDIPELYRARTLPRFKFVELSAEALNRIKPSKRSRTLATFAYLTMYLRRELNKGLERDRKTLIRKHHAERLEALEVSESATPEERPPLAPFGVPPASITTSEATALDSLASLAGDLSPSEFASARLLALRLFGDLTLEDIASRDGCSLEAVRTEWSAARAWLAKHSVEAPAAVGRIVTLDMCDRALLEVIRTHPELLRSVHWRAFENILAALLEHLGYAIELQRGTKDGGIDIFALRYDSPLGPHRYIIQAKRWQNHVGVEPVRELLFLRQYHNVTKACLATTSAFTRGAWALAEEHRWQLELRDFEKLQEWIAAATTGRPTSR